MAVVTTLSNHYKFELMSANIDYDSHTFKIILMNNTFAFDKDTHAQYSDVSADELAAGNGYTVGGITLANIVLTEDDVNDRGRAVWDNVQWDASGGDIGPTGAAIIYNDTHANDVVVGCIDFGTDYTISDGSSLQIQNIAVNTT